MYNYLLNIRFRNYVLVIIVPLLLILCFFLAGTIKIYDHFDTVAVFDGNSFIIDVDVANIDKYYNSDFVIIDNEKYQYKIISVSEIKIDYYRNYQSISFFVDNFSNTLLVNEIKKITFCSNKESILKKIIKIIF